MLWADLTQSNIIEEHKKLVAAIYDFDYYVKTFERTRESFELNENVPAQICAFWNNFWYNLPDHAGIQRDPFSRVCDMAEGDYLEDEDYEQ